MPKSRKSKKLRPRKKSKRTQKVQLSPRKSQRWMIGMMQHPFVDMMQLPRAWIPHLPDSTLPLHGGMLLLVELTSLLADRSIHQVVIRHLVVAMKHLGGRRGE